MLKPDEAPVDVCEDIASCLRMMAGRAEGAGVALESRCPDDLAALRGDAQKLEQGLVNLFSNGIEFTPVEVASTSRRAWIPTASW